MTTKNLDPVEPLDNSEYQDYKNQKLGKNQKKKKVHRYHGFLRSSKIKSSTLLQYTKKFYRKTDDEGNLEIDFESKDKISSAVKKYKESKKRGWWNDC